MSHESAIQVTSSPFPAPEDKSGFGMQGPLSLEPQDDLGMPPFPSQGTQDIGSSSEERGEHYNTILYIRLTLAHAGWKWGQLPPSPKEVEEEGRPSPIAEVGSMHELVCPAIHTLV
jgi:hypothetical protein